MARHPSIFPTFFLSGFECSTFRWKDKRRRDLVAETQHREHASEDYALLRDLGIAVSREGIPWPLVAKRDYYDFTPIDSLIAAMNQHQILPIWDLCHYGYPDDLDPFAQTFPERFAAYCRAAAEYVAARLHGPYYFTPINEINYFASMGCEWGWIAPYRQDEAERQAFRLALCRADIAGVRAIRSVLPEARMIHIDPLEHVVAPRDQPHLRDEAREETYQDTFYCWDVLAGQRHPEFGGTPEILDIAGVNNYSFGQMVYEEDGQHRPLEPGDARVEPLADLLERAWRQYHRPVIIAETSGLGEGRPAWLKDVMAESLAAVERGVDLHAVCLFPAVTMPDWHTGEWLQNGLCDVREERGVLHRVPYQPYIEELRRWQRLLKRVTVLDENPFDEPMDLDDVVAAAHKLQMESDRNWH